MYVWAPQSEHVRSAVFESTYFVPATHVGCTVHAVTEDTPSAVYVLAVVVYLLDVQSLHMLMSGVVVVSQ